MKKESKIVTDHNEFFQAIDRIKVAGFISLETKRDQLFYKALNELNEILSMSIKLIVSDQNEYNKLFNAEWVLSSRFDLDYSEIFSTDNPEQFDFEIVKKSKRENLIKRKSIKYGFHSLVSGISSLRNECLRFGRIDLARTLNEGIIELLTKITESEFDNYEHVRYQNELRLLVEDLVYQSLDMKDDMLIYLKNQGFYSWYFSCIYNNDFDIKRLLKILDDHFFMSVRRAINKNENKVLESLAGSLIDGMLINSAQVEFNFIERRGWGEPDHRRKLDKQLHQGISTMRNVYLGQEFNDMVDHFDNIWTELSPRIINDQRTEFENLKSHVSKSLRENFLFNHLRINIIHLLAYAQFKEKYDVLNTFLDYNQPVGNVSSYSNQDILPVNLNEIKEIGIRRYSIENRFYYLWDNHRDNEPYLNNVLIILMARIFYLNKNNFTFKNIYFKNEEEKRNFQGFIEKLNQSRVENILNNRIYRVFDSDFIDEFKVALNQIKHDIDEHLIGLWLEKEVSQERIDEFKEVVRKGISSYASLMNIYRYYGKLNNQSSDEIEYRYIGINQLDPKGYFVEGSGGIYVDWPGSYARLISENFEGFLGSEISKVAERRKCPKYQLLDKLNKEELSNKIIISRNFRLSFETLRNNKDFTPINQNSFIDQNNTGFVGEYKGIPIYEIFSQSSQWESILILHKDDIGRILRAIPDMQWMDKSNINGFEFFDIHDFVGKQELIQEIINEDLPWMRNMDQDEKVNKLKDSVSIRYYQKLAFEQPIIPPIIYNF